MSSRTTESIDKFLGIDEKNDPSRQPIGTFQELFNAETQPKALEKRKGFRKLHGTAIEGQPRVKYLKHFISSNPDDLRQLLIGTDDGKLHAIHPFFKKGETENELKDRIEVIPGSSVPIPDLGAPGDPITEANLDTIRDTIQLIVEEQFFTPPGSTTPYSTIDQVQTDAGVPIGYTNASPVTSVAPIDIHEMVKVINQVSYKNYTEVLVAHGSANIYLYNRNSGGHSTYGEALAAGLAVAGTSQLGNMQIERNYDNDSPTSFIFYSFRVGFKIDTSGISDDSRLEPYGVSLRIGHGSSNVWRDDIQQAGSIVEEIYVAPSVSDITLASNWEKLEQLIATKTWALSGSPSDLTGTIVSYVGASAINRSGYTIFISRIKDDNVLIKSAPVSHDDQNGDVLGSSGLAANDYFGVTVLTRLKVESIPNYKMASARI